MLLLHLSTTLAKQKEAAYAEYAEAEVTYQHHLYKVPSNSAKMCPASLCTITEHYDSLLSYQTLGQQINSQRFAHEFAVAHTTLTKEEANVMAVLTEAEWGFPYTHQSLKQKCESILHAQHE